MKKIVFTEEFCQPENLFPFTLTRRIQDIRVGLRTIREKWEDGLGLTSFDRDEGDHKGRDRVIDLPGEIGKDTIYLVHGNVIPTPQLIKAVKKLKPGECLSFQDKESLVYCISGGQVLEANRIQVKKSVPFEGELPEIRFPWDILHWNKWAIAQDFDWLSANRKRQKPNPSNSLINGSQVFIEKGAIVTHSILNATDGPIFIAAGATVMEGSLLRGPVVIGAGATVKMGTRIYGATTIGPGCLAGGEIKNSVFFAYSNKGHDGYVGDSVIGEWCNLGAGTSNSNLKNNASDIMVWTPGGMVNVGRKCGVMMGDYTRTAINTSINTGTVIGACCNVFGNGLTPKYIPSFSWGCDGVERYGFEKALSDIANWKSLKHQQVTESEKFILKHIFDHH
jgi:UDP-N-acetylglucosamine diphosphorylase/glucosamine-1-phosphate N-acetyltransferase